MESAHVTDATPDSPAREARLADAIDVLGEVFGFPGARMRTVSRRLQDAGSLPRGSYTSTPMVGVPHFVTLLVGLCADATLRETPAAASDLDALAWAVHGNDVDADATAGSFLVGLCEVALRGEAWVRELKIEFVADRREVVVDFGRGVLERFCEPGASEAQGHMVKTTVIAGEGLAEAVEKLFGGFRSA